MCGSHTCIIGQGGWCRVADCIECFAVSYGKTIYTLEILRQRVFETQLPIIYANMVGGQDELVFDGGSFVLDAEGS